MCFSGLLEVLHDEIERVWWGQSSSMQNRICSLCWGYSGRYVKDLWPWGYLKGENLWLKVTQVHTLPSLLFHSYFPPSNVYFKMFLLRKFLPSFFFIALPFLGEILLLSVSLWVVSVLILVFAYFIVPASWYIIFFLAYFLNTYCVLKIIEKHKYLYSVFIAGALCLYKRYVQ